MDSAAKSEPVIGKAAWVSPLYYAGSAIVMEALPDSLDSPHSIWFDGGEIDVEQSARHQGQVQQRAQNLFAPSLCAGEGHGISHAFPRVCLTWRNRSESCQRSFHSGGNGAGTCDILGDVEIGREHV